MYGSVYICAHMFCWFGSWSRACVWCCSLAVCVSICARLPRVSQLQLLPPRRSPFSFNYPPRRRLIHLCSPPPSPASWIQQVRVYTYVVFYISYVGVHVPVGFWQRHETSDSLGNSPRRSGPSTPSNWFPLEFACAHCAGPFNSVTSGCPAHTRLHSRQLDNGLLGGVPVGLAVVD